MKIVKVPALALTALLAGALLPGAVAQDGGKITAGPDPNLNIRITVDPASVPVGKAVTVTAVATRLGQPLPQQELWAYLNGRQWGAQGITDAAGRATFILPMPYGGKARIQVALPPPGFLWPNAATVFGQTSDFIVGTPLSRQVAASNLVNVAITPRAFSPTIDPQHLIGCPWSPWFTKYNAQIDGGHVRAEGVPLLGSYASANPDVIRQQMLWMDEIGVNFVQVDWSNNLSHALHWQNHLPGVDELVGATRALLDTLVQMRSEGLPTPQVVLLLGMAPPFSMAALNEELKFVHESLVLNPKYAGLFVTYLGKPLVNILSVLDDTQLRTQGRVDGTDFTIRWVWVNVKDRPGWWSWVDAYLPPTTTFHDGEAEAMTVTCAVCAGKGWKDPQSLGKRDGATWLRGFQTALAMQPRFLFLHQFNDWGEEYDTELSDDFEPAALSSLGAGDTGKDRGAGPGWGFYYLNLARAFVEIYHHQAPESTVLTVENPLRDREVSGSFLKIEWQTIGKAVSSYTIGLDGTVQAQGVTGNSYALPLSNLSQGSHTVTVSAAGAVTRFALSWEADDEPDENTRPCSVTVPFNYR